MSVEDDTELRDLIIDALEKKGVLAKIKAELRASVFLALEETDNEKYKIPLSNDAIQKFQETKDGRTSLSLVRDFLEFFHLDYTLAVLDTEISPFKAIIKKSDLEKDLNLNSCTDVPLLTHLLRSPKVPQANFSAFGTRNSEWKNEMNLLQTTSKPDNTFLVNDVLNANSGAGDPFFDEPISAGREQFPFSITGGSKTSLSGENALNSEAKKSTENQIPQNSFVTVRGQPNDLLAEEDILSGLLKKRTGKAKTLTNEPRVLTSESSLSSLKDLPSLNVKPKIQDDYEDDFQSSESGKSGSKDGEKNDNHAKDNTEGSIDDDIEEDISIPADDLLNTSASVGDDNDVTSDRTISHLSGVGGYDYMEKLS